MTVTSNSPNISQLDFNILFDLSTTTPSIVLTNNSTYPSGSNRTNCTWWYEVITPSGTFIHQGAESTPDVSGDWTTKNISGANWPQPFKQIEWSGSQYQAILYFKDANGTIFFEKKLVKICRPVGLTSQTEGNFGVGNATIQTKCDSAKLLVQDASNYAYNGNFGYPVSRSMKLAYPLDEDGNSTTPVTLTNLDTGIFSIPFSGEGFTFILDNVYQYDFDNNASIKIKYKYRKSFGVYCNIDLCPLVCDFNKLIEDVKNSNCGSVEARKNEEKLNIISGMMHTAFMAVLFPDCAIKPLPEIIKDIKDYAGFGCDCYVKGNVPKSSNGLLNIAFNTDCGDIEASVDNVGDNFTITLRNKQTSVLLDATMESAGFSIDEDTDTECLRKFIISFDKSQFPYPTACCPVKVPIYIHNTSNAPDECPASFYPAKVYNVADNTVIGTADDAAHLVSILNADASWQAIGKVLAGGNCHVFIIPVDPDASMPNVHVDEAEIPCPNGVKTFSANIIDYCDGLNKASILYPGKFFVSYDNGTTKYSLGLIANYAALITAITNEPNKPANYSFSQNANPLLYDVAITQLDCQQTDTTKVYVDQDTYLAVAANHHSSVFGSGGGIYAIHMDTEQSLGKVCGEPVDKYPYHVRKIGNFVYSVETDTGVLKKFDYSNPLFPVLVSSLQLPNSIGINTPFSGIPTKGGIPSHWDVYFPTDYDPSPQFLYIVESTSGVIYKYNVASDTLVSYFSSGYLLGRCPRIVFNNKLWLSLDGNVLNATGQTASALADDEDVVILDLTNFSPFGFSTIDVTTVSAGMPLYALSYDNDDAMVYATYFDGTIVKINATSQAIVQTYSGAFNPSFGMGSYTNTKIIKDINGTKRLYAACFSAGTRAVTLPGITGTAFAFNNQMIDGNGNPFSNNVHYNVTPVPGRCYLLLTFDNGANPGGVAKYTYDGNFIALTSVPAGDVYNVVLFQGLGSVTPNGFC